MSQKQKETKDEKESWRVKSLDEIREERKKKQESSDSSSTKKDPLPPAPETVVVLDTASSEHDEEEQRRRRASSTDERMEDINDALNIQPPQRQARKDHKSRRKEEKRRHSRKDADSRKRKDKHGRSHSSEKHSKHRDYSKRDKGKDKISSRGRKERKEEVRAIPRLMDLKDLKRVERKGDRRDDFFSLGRERGPPRERDYRDPPPPLMERKPVRERLGHHHLEEVHDRQRREERQRELYWREGGRPDDGHHDSRERSRDWHRDPERGRDGSREGKHDDRRRDEGPRIPEPTRRVVSLIDRPQGPRDSPSKSREGATHQRDRSTHRKEREENIKEQPRDRSKGKAEKVHEIKDDEEERPVSDFELEKEQTTTATEGGEEEGSSEESGDSDESDDSSEESDSSDEDDDEDDDEEEGEEVDEGPEREEGEASASEESSSEEEEEASEDESESAEDSEASKEEEELKPKVEDATTSKFESPAKEEDVTLGGTSDHPAEDGMMPHTPEGSPVELKESLPPYYPALRGCRNVEEFEHLNKIEEGTYGVVYRAREKRNDEIVALKRLKMEKEKEGFPITSLREINTLLKAQHVNIVTVREIVVGSNMDKIYIVMDYVEHDLKSLMETMKQPFTVGETKCLLLQLLRGVKHLHENWILHRDLKTSNLLLSHKGVLKIGDFGLAREYGSPLKQYTPIVVTLWYRAPELLLGIKEYSVKIDMWSVGCIFAEFLTMKPLFPGKSEIDQLNKIFKELGTPSEKIWPGYNELPAVRKMTFTEYPYNNLRNRFGTYLTDSGFDLLNKFLTYNPSKRVSAEESLRHEYFQESPLPIKESMFPTWPAKSEGARSAKRSPKAPEGGLQFNNLGEDEGESGFRLTLPSHGTSAVGPGFNLKF